MIISRRFLLRIKNVSEKSVEKIKIHFMSNELFPPENRAVCEIMWKNIVEPNGPHDITVWHRYRHTVCLIAKAIDIYTEYAIRLLFHGSMVTQTLLSVTLVSKLLVLSLFGVCIVIL
jgi:hypothetical protein